MRRLHAWSSNKKGKFTIPIYHKGPWWAIFGEELTTFIIGYLFKINNWFEKFTLEYKDEEIKDQN